MVDIEKHPYNSFFPSGSKKLILGSFPPHRFTQVDKKNSLDEKDIDFYYGSRFNYLWPLVSDNCAVDLSNPELIMNFLISKKVGITDIIERCRRKLTITGTPSALDKDLEIIDFRNIEEILNSDSLLQILCTSKYVHENFLKHYQCRKCVEVIVLPSPSRSASRAIGRSVEYKELKSNSYNTINFRRAIYKKYL